MVIWGLYVRFIAWSCVLIGASVYGVGIARAQGSNGDSGQPVPLQEVTVTAQKLTDERRLDQVIIPRFVKSHGAPSPYSHQVGRWTAYLPICPSTTGLKPAFNDYVSHRVLAVATRVGAPTAKNQHCKFTVEIIFTANPQEQVSYFGKSYRDLLGYDGGSLQELLTFNHAIRAWYTTGTQSTSGASWTLDSDKPPVATNFGRFDAPINKPQLDSASRFSVGMVSSFGNVLVIADSRKITQLSLSSIADYVAMLVLTRTSVDGCNELPSIIDLLSADCGGRTPPDAITPADIAYLKALYSADLEKSLIHEEGDIHDRMSGELLGK
jgi:hypothetical protein